MQCRGRIRTGSDYKYQISSVTEFSLKRVGTFPFSMYRGSCFNANEHILLCFGAATVMQNEMFYVFGGFFWTWRDNTPMSTISKYNPDNDKWTKIGNLNTARQMHDVMINQGAFLIIGDGPTEKCELESNLMSCLNQEPVISRYG